GSVCTLPARVLSILARWAATEAIAAASWLQPERRAASPPRRSKRLPYPFKRLFLVQLADQRQGEIRAHVFEVRTHAQADAVPARLAFDVADVDLGGAQRTAATYFGARILLVGDELADPLVQFQ